jgi:hypothetical protein
VHGSTIGGLSPTCSNYDVVPPGVVFRVQFKVAGEAMAFAEAFHGRVLD